MVLLKEMGERGQIWCTLLYCDIWDESLTDTADRYRANFDELICYNHAMEAYRTVLSKISKNYTKSIFTKIIVATLLY